MLRSLILVSFAFLLLRSHAQINGYAQVTAISGNTCSIGATNETASTFQVGKHVVIMQMQDDVIGENTFNNSSFGDLGSINKAGSYTVREIVSLERSGGTLTSVTLDLPPGVEFSFSPNASVQMITYELLGGGGDFTTTSNIGAIGWNGTIGGVLAFRVEGILYLEHNISVNSAGFRGGVRTTTNEGSCSPDTYVYDASGPLAAQYAGKGEGIYRTVGTGWARGRGRILNGGGGGNGNNGGGGGGSNFTSGGEGGAGFDCASDASGGLGGVALGAYSNSTRLFMGGGGGGGEGDGNSSSVGMRGGGIILIKADMVRTTGSCGGRTISANGGNANASGTDGAGGGGAAGTIMMHVTAFDIAAGCPLTLTANGGNGGNVNNAVDHGGGGGGGQGAIYFKGVIPLTNVTILTNNGIGGCNNNSSPCNSQAESGGGTNGAGIFYYDLSPLPVELLAFDALPKEGVVDLLWSTASENYNELFVIERSTDGHAWEAILRTEGAGQGSTQNDYTARDEQPIPGSSYYRLAQVASNGTPTYSHAVHVHLKNNRAGSMVLFPNPANERVSIFMGDAIMPAELRIYNELGQAVGKPLLINSVLAEVDITMLPPGVYVAVITGDGLPKTEKLIVQR